MCFGNFILLYVVITSLILFHQVRCEFNLTIIHNNDFHANYLPIKYYNNAECYDNYENDSNCVAGAARTVAEVKKFRQTKENLLFLNAGDHFQGTSWYTLLKSSVVAQFVKLMKHDVMTLGNHEFDDGPEELENFINMMNMHMNDKLPIVCCNIVVDKSLKLHGMIQKSIVFNINGTKVAIIGYITPDTKFLSNPGKKIKFRDEIEAIQEEIDSLKAKHSDLKIFIGLGHSGYDRDIEIADKISDLDLIVGGHSHTYLYSGKNPSSVEKPMGNYPTVYEHQIRASNFENNRSTLIVQAFALGKYLGWIKVYFNDDGEIIDYKGKPIFLNYNSPQDDETKELVKSNNEKISVMFNETFCEANEEFPNQDCRSKECAIGNLITDSFVNRFYSLQDQKLLRTSCDLIALINGGNIRTSIDKGPISYRNLISVLPFSNNLGLLTINGSELIDIFKHSAEQHDRGGFLQLSGLQVTYKINECKTLTKKSRLIDLKVRCNNKWNPVEESNIYLVLINNFLVNGGDNYLIDNKKWINYQFSDRDILKEYISKLKNITPILEGRIKFENSSYSSIKIASIHVIVTYILLSTLWNLW